MKQPQPPLKCIEAIVDNIELLTTSELVELGYQVTKELNVRFETDHEPA